MTPKYQGEQDPAVHGGQVHWPGGPKGYPVRTRGGVPITREQQYQQLQVTCDFKAKAFCTWDPESLAEYQSVMDRCANKLFQLRKQLQEYDPQAGGWRFWVEWLQLYETEPIYPRR